MRGAVVAILVLGCGGSAKPAGPAETAGPAGPAETAAGSQQPQEPRPTESAPTERAPAPKPPAAPAEATALPAPEPVAGPGAPTGRPAKSGSTQAEIAARLAAEGKEAVLKEQFAVASQKFREAVARVPEAAYFFNLCLSLFLEGKFSESLTACSAVEHSNPTPELKQKTEKMIVRIKDEARRQSIKVAP